MKETLIRFLQMKECTYKIYLDYCKTMHKEVELLQFNELGIDSMFDTPYDAVKELYDNNITFDNTNYIYRDDNNKICGCLYASEGIDMEAIAQWIIDGKCSSVTYDLLSLSNAIFDITDMTFPMLDDDDTVFKLVDVAFGKQRFKVLDACMSLEHTKANLVAESVVIRCH